MEEALAGGSEDGWAVVVVSAEVVGCDLKIKIILEFQRLLYIIIHLIDLWKSVEPVKLDAK